MAQEKSSWHVLGLEEGATAATIEEAYRRKREELEKRLKIAPTQALKEKYQNELGQLEGARRAALAHDPSQSPILKEDMLHDLPSAVPLGPPRSPETSGKPVEPPQRGGEEPGQLLTGRYELVRQIGADDLGSLYEADDRAHHDKVTVRYVAPELLTDDAVREGFLRDVKMWRSLSHPNIARCIDYQFEDNVSIIVMEHLDGHTLRSEIDKRKVEHKVFRLEEAGAIGKGLSSALAYAHGTLRHGDVRPENVWLSSDGQAKLMNFGFAQLREKLKSRTTVDPYSPPEMMGGLKELDARSDQYSLAAVLYEVITGKPPLAPAKPAKEVRKDVPPALSAAVGKALSKKPEHRFPDLRLFGHAVSITSRASTKVVAAVAAGVILFLVGGGYLFFGDWWAGFSLNRQYSNAVSEGATALGAQKFEDAAKSFRKALKIKPQGAEAISGLKQAESGLDEKNYQAHIAEGRAALGKNKPVDAEQAFKKALEIKADGKEALEGLKQARGAAGEESYKKAIEDGKDELRRKKWEAARDAYLTALSVKPGDSAAQYGLQQAEQGIKQELYEKHLKLGQAAILRQEWEAATEAFNQALAVKPDDLDALKGKKEIESGKKSAVYTASMHEGKEAQRAGEWDKSEQAFLAALKAKPEDKDAMEALKATRNSRDQERRAEAEKKGGTLHLATYPTNVQVFMSDGSSSNPVDAPSKDGKFAIEKLPLQKPLTFEVKSPGWITKTIGPIEFDVDKMEIRPEPLKLEPSVATLAVVTMPANVKVQLDQTDVGETGADNTLLVPQVRTGVSHELKLAKEGFETRTLTISIPESFHGTLYRMDTARLKGKGQVEAGPAPGVQPLFAAAKSGDANEVKRVLESGVAANSKDEDNVTPLAWACDGGHLEAVKALLDSGADPNMQDNIGATSLMWAAKKGNAEIIKLLIDKKANVQSKDKSGATALLWAAAEGNGQAVKALVDAGSELNVKNETGVTPLIAAASSGNQDTVRIILEKGVDPNVRDHKGRTALYEAVEKGKADVVRVLLEKGADVDAETDGKWTPLVAAADSGNTEVVKLLLEKGAKKQGSAASRMATLRGNTEMVKLLKRFGAK